MRKEPPSIGLPEKTREQQHWFFWAMLIFIPCWCLGFCITTTQKLAAAWNYQLALGEPIFGRLYNPLKWIEWIRLYGKTHSDTILDVLLVVTAIFIVIGVIGYFLIALFTRRTHAVSTLHGSARWAERCDIENAGFVRRKEGILSMLYRKCFGSRNNAERKPEVYIGAWDDEGEVIYLTHRGPEHVFTLAPTRSGKGVGLIIPTLLAWNESAVVYDLKGENYELTAGYRKSIGQKILKFDPMDTSGLSARYNPIAEARIGTENEVADVQNIANMIVDPDGNGLPTHWDKTAFSFLTGVILHVCYVEREKGRTATLPDIAAALSGSEGINALYHDMRHNKFLNGREHPTIARAAIDMMDKDERERGSVLSTAKTFFMIYNDPIIARNIEMSDFTARSLMTDERASTLYLVIDPANQERVRPLLRLMLTQILRNNTPRLQFKEARQVKSYKHQLLMLLDEFPALKRLPIITESIATAAGYGIKFYIFVQDLMQLYDAYGDKESITSNCHIRIAYAPNKQETAEVLSKWTGTATVLDRKTSISGKRTGIMLNQTTESQEHYSRPLLTPDECMRLPVAKKDGNGMILEAGDMLIFSAGFPPIYGKQMLYFIDPVLSKRSRIPPPTQSARKE
jgi:type IV secretion system protein VirD4